MKVLIATPEKYASFVREVIQPYALDHTILVNSHNLTTDFTGYDVGISFLWEKRIKKFELEIAPWINFHPAPLPEYKGRNLCYHAIMNGEIEFGATVHYMDENFDTGDIIEVVKQFMFPSDTADILSKRTIELSKELFRAYLPRIFAGEKFERHPNIGGTYYKKEPINDNVNYHNYRQERLIRAIYFPPYYPTMIIGGVRYKIVKDECESPY